MVSQLKNSERPLAKDRRWQIPPKPWRFLIVTVLLIGIFFRFANLENKPYWWDEVINSIHSAGYSKQDFSEQVEAWKDKDLTIEDLHKYQYPTSETTSLDVIRALADGEPQSPPVYYLLSRWWTQLFGSSVTVQRSLSACISLLAFPSMYWLCLELFGSSVAAWIGVMLIAISPFHLLFAQEVRMYVLWTVTILISSASLLRAIRLQRKRDWGIYAASLTLSLYTFPFSILVAIAHGIYVAIAEVPKSFKSIDRSSQAQIKISKTLSNYLISSIASIIAYAPWIVPLIQIDETKMHTWRQTTLPFSDLFKYWLIQTSLIFADLNPKYRGGSGGADSSLANFYDPLSFFPMILIWVAIIYALYFLMRNSPQPIWSFILSLILVTALTLVLPDLTSGGMRSTVARYLIPCYLGIQLSIVNLIYRKIYFQPTIPLAKKIWSLILAIFLSAGIISCSLIINSPTWWIKSINSQNIPIAEIINSSENPLILTPEDSASHLISISHNLTNNVTVRFVDKADVNEMSKVFSDKFLLNYPQKWLDLIEKENKFKLEEIYKGKAVEDPASELNFSLVRIL
ncbi:MAG: glycosyltransferase family 39 protein [Waterburya sp.]